MAAKKRVTLYLSKEMLDETRQEAKRLDRTISWLLQLAWKHARAEIKVGSSMPMAKADANSWTHEDQSSDEQETG